MSVWSRSHGFVHYYTLDNDVEQIAPYGKIGPFPGPREMRDAMDLISARFPDATIVSRRCSLDDSFVTDAELDGEYAKALDKMEAMQ